MATLLYSLTLQHLSGLGSRANISSPVGITGLGFKFSVSGLKQRRWCSVRFEPGGLRTPIAKEFPVCV